MREPGVLKRPDRRLVGSTTLIVAALTTVNCSDQFAPDPSRPNAAAAAVAPIILVGAGDITGCSIAGAGKTAELVKSILNANPTAWAFLAGDNAYEDGSTADYNNCYNPTWGQFKARTRPSLGNHEYDGVELAAPSFNYFGDELWGNSRARGGYYSFNLGESWHIVVLNSNSSFVPTAVASPQDSWLQADLAANTRPCIAAIWHHPRFYSIRDTVGSPTLQRGAVKPFWDRLYAAGADLVLNGHSHNYERFKPQTPDGVVDLQRGIREFIVGMGGKSVRPVITVHPNSEKREGDTYGVIELTLSASSYSWRFVPEPGKTFSDAGTSNCHGSDGSVEPPPPPPPPTNGNLLVGAGAIADCSLSSDEATAKLLDALPSATVFTTGDGASSTGSATEYANCYGPTWGRHKARTRPAVGYMDYKSGSPAGYFSYFGSAAGASGSGYYSYNLGDWHIIALNSLIPMSRGSAQETWLRADLNANPKVCTLAYIARARFSSGKAGNSTGVQPLWQALYEKGADVIVAGSDHVYERFARQTPAGVADATNGIQEFVVGTGGLSLTGLIAPQPNSVVFNGSTHGVLKLTLGATSYSWEFVPVAGSTFRDTGSMDCVGAPPPTPNDAPTASFSEDCTGLSCAFTDASIDNDGTIKSRSWEFGDGATSAATNPTHPYPAAGNYTVKLTVTDDDDAASLPETHEITVTVQNTRPTAAFEPNCVGLACDFDNSSEDLDGTIVDWDWDFGDTGTENNSHHPAPSHTYAVAGQYTVKLTVKDDDGATGGPVTRTVVVAEPGPPTAAFDSPNCTVDLPCSFDDKSADDGPIATRKWDFDDGTAIVESAEDPVSHAYTTAALYHVTLTVKDADGLENSVTHDVTVSAAPPPPENQAPTAAFGRSCNNLTCTFTDQSTDPDAGGSIKSWSWNFGDGSPISTAQNPPPHTYAAGGSKTVTLTVTDDGDKPSAPVSQTFTVAANGAPTAAFGRSCNNLACTFTDQSTDPDPGGTIKTWSWNFGDGNTSTVRNPPNTYVTGGSKTVTLTVTDNADKPSAPASQTFSVAANVAPTAAFNAPTCTAGVACSFTNTSSDGDGTIVSRSWNFGDGGTSSSNSPSRTYAAAGTYTVRLTVTDDDGATGTTTRSVTVTAPTTNRIPTALFGSACTKLSCAFTDRSTDPDGNATIVKWTWNFGDGSTSTIRNPTRVYKAGGSYKVKLTVTDNRGASDPITHTVTVAP